jgi:hypothetical protein
MKTYKNGCHELEKCSELENSEHKKTPIKIGVFRNMLD